MLSPAIRLRFDDLLAAIIDELPPDIHALLEEVPVIVEDEPSNELLRELGMSRRRSELCGLHSGVALTRRSVEHHARLPDQVMLFRGPIVRVVNRMKSGRPGVADLEEQIRVTLLHEIGHHFGLDEEDLARLGYG